MADSGGESGGKMFGSPFNDSKGHGAGAAFSELGGSAVGKTRTDANARHARRDVLVNWQRAPSPSG